MHIDACRFVASVAVAIDTVYRFEGFEIIHMLIVSSSYVHSFRISNNNDDKHLQRRQQTNKHLQQQQ